MPTIIVTLRAASVHLSSSTHRRAAPEKGHSLLALIKIQAQRENPVQLEK
jgi:hypothetical protein